MKRRINLAAGLVNQPRLLFLDEPTVGVDPQSRNHIFESVERLNREQGMTHPLHHALHGGGRAPLPPRRHHRPRQADRAGHAPQPDRVAGRRHHPAWPGRRRRTRTGRGGGGLARGQGGQFRDTSRRRRRQAKPPPREDSAPSSRSRRARATTRCSRCSTISTSRTWTCYRSTCWSQTWKRSFST
jgi:hypothetical protein